MKLRSAGKLIDNLCPKSPRYLLRKNTAKISERKSTVSYESKPVISLESNKVNEPESKLVIPSERDLVKPFSTLPPEICEKILEKLEPVDLLWVSGVSKFFKHLCKSSFIWKKKCMEAGINGMSFNTKMFF